MDEFRLVEQLQAIWDSAFDAMITIDRNGIITTANRATEKMFGYSSNELLGCNVSILMPKPFRDEHDSYIQRYHASGKARILNAPRELVALHKDGSTFPIDLSVTQVDNTGYFTGIIRDISDRKQMQQHLLEIASEEQRRIGRELHDQTGQELTGLSLTAGALLEMINSIPLTTTGTGPIRQLDEHEFKRIHEAVSTINRRLIEANRHIQELSHGIVPVQIDAAALQAALQELAQSTNMPPTIRCHFDCPRSIKVKDNSVATHLYRIAQEAVTNAVRHGQASEIVLSLIQHGRELILEVNDNGSGIEQTYCQLAQSRKNQGMGMRTMQYRAGIIGGTLQIERREAGGTSVKCISLVSTEA